MPNQVTITACDNELIVLAYTMSDSYELCRVLSGNGNSVNVTLDIESGTYRNSIQLNGVTRALDQTITQSIPSGSYSLLLLGIDWGGPGQFTVEVNGTPQSLPYTENGDGLLFNPGPIAITV